MEEEQVEAVSEAKVVGMEAMEVVFGAVEEVERIEVVVQYEGETFDQTAALEVPAPVQVE